MYYGLIFLHAQQCKTIHELTTYFVTWANLPEQIQELHEIPERASKGLYEKKS